MKPSIKETLCLETMPTVLGKSYEMEAFVIGHHVYKETWTLFWGEKLDTVIQPNNAKDKYSVTILQEGEKKVIRDLQLGKSGKFAKPIFYFLKTAIKNRCQIIIHAKAVNQNDGLKMKVPF